MKKKYCMGCGHGNSFTADKCSYCGRAFFKAAQEKTIETEGLVAADFPHIDLKGLFEIDGEFE